MAKRNVTVHPPTVKKAGDTEKQATWTLLPMHVPEGACTTCGREHDPLLPHDLQRLPYQYAFYAEHDRWPTWDDAMAHCTPEVQEQWRSALRTRGLDI